MSVKKYRLCLTMFAIILLVAGVWFYVHNSKQEQSYKDGTLVLREYRVEETV